MIYGFVISIIMVLTVKRMLYWLSVLQQKEYRTDRLLLFLKSKEGTRAFFSLLPLPKEFSRTGLKRPKITLRIFVITAMSVSLLIIWSIVFTRQESLITISALVIFYIFTPIIVASIAAISSIPANLITATLLFLASSKLRQTHPLVIGITGSYGKTSTKLLLNHVLSTTLNVHCTPKSFNTPLSMSRDILQNYHNEKILVLEFAAYRKGEIQKLTSFFSPEIAVVTGFAPQHLGLFGSEDQIKQAKAELVQAVPNTNPVFCNGDDDGAIEICKLGKKEPTLYHADLLKDMQLDMNGHLSFVWNRTAVHTQLVGLHYANNIACVISVAEYLGMKPQDIILALQRFNPPDSFMQIIRGKQGAQIIDDGRTSNPKGFIAALSLLKAIKKDHTILITNGIVDLGRSSESIHLELAKKAKEIVDTVIYTGSEGKEQFSQVFGDHCIWKEQDMARELEKAKQTTSILIEGFLPKKYEVYL